jgi:hypothetical protein
MGGKLIQLTLTLDIRKRSLGAKTRISPNFKPCCSSNCVIIRAYFFDGSSCC